MADLTPKENLQPSLLDRLTDDEPTKMVESRDSRVLSIERLHDCVIRDLSWLLNSENISSVLDLSDYPDAEASTLNYGILPLSGQVIGRSDRQRLEANVRESILRFEPRLLANTVKVNVVQEDAEMRPNALRFEIGATVWAQPLPIQLLVTADVDLETGEFKVVQ